MNKRTHTQRSNYYQNRALYYYDGLLNGMAWYNVHNILTLPFFWLSLCVILVDRRTYKKFLGEADPFKFKLNIAESETSM